MPTQTGYRLGKRKLVTTVFMHFMVAIGVCSIVNVIVRHFALLRVRKAA